jgi:hypothetical protein
VRFCRGFGTRFQEMLSHGCLVKFVRLPFGDPDGILRTLSETGAQAITQVIGGEDRLSAYDPDGAFRTGGDAEAAAVAFFFIDLDYLSYHLQLLRD